MWDLEASLGQCKFYKSEIEFLDYIISDTGIHMSQDKVQMILEREHPKSHKEVQAFIGFQNFYHRFINNFSMLAKSLMDSTSEQFKDKN
jgi:hypothetical protein